MEARAEPTKIRLPDALGISMDGECSIRKN
jgi:hypothetical protein